MTDLVNAIKDDEDVVLTIKLEQPNTDCVNTKVHAKGFDKLLLMPNR